MGVAGRRPFGCVPALFLAVDFHHVDAIFSHRENVSPRFFGRVAPKLQARAEVSLGEQSFRDLGCRDFSVCDVAQRESGRTGRAGFARTLAAFGVFANRCILHPTGVG